MKRGNRGRGSHRETIEAPLEEEATGFHPVEVLGGEEEEEGEEGGRGRGWEEEEAGK